MPARSICLLRLSAIGDVTHMLPVVATLQQQWPDTRITWVIGKLEYQLVKQLPGVEFVVFDKSGGWSEYLKLRKALKSQRFDLLLLMQVSLRASIASLMIRAKKRVGYDEARSRDMHWLFCNQRISGDPRVHVLDGFFQFLETIGINDRRMDWLLKADTSSAQFASGIIDNKPTVVINPCSSARNNNWRNWSIEGYATIVDFLVDRDYQVVLTGGPAQAEKDFAESIQQASQQKSINLVGQTSLMQLLAILEQSLCLIAPDTGPAHMGTVAGIPVIGLYASSNPLRSGPYRSQATTVNAYPEELRHYSKKSVEEARWGERVRDPDVMSVITVDAVITKLSECLQRTNRLNSSAESD